MAVCGESSDDDETRSEATGSSNDSQLSSRAAELEAGLCQSSNFVSFGAYVDECLEGVSGIGVGRYQWRALFLFGICWGVVAANTYLYHFLASEPDIGAVTGRVVLDRDKCVGESSFVLDGYLIPCTGIPIHTCPQVLESNLSKRCVYGGEEFRPGNDGILKLTLNDSQHCFLACEELGKDECGQNRSDWTFRSPSKSIKADLGLYECSGIAERWPLVQTLYFLGWGFGVSANGVLSDKRGRVVAYLASLVIMELGVILATWAFSWQFFAVGRFVTGFGAGGFGMTSYTWCSEVLGASLQSQQAVLPNLWFTLGGFVVAPVALLITRWRWYYMFFFAIGLPCFSMPLIFFESPKWLASRADAIAAKRGKTKTVDSSDSDGEGGAQHVEALYVVMCGIARANKRANPVAPHSLVKHGGISEARRAVGASFCSQLCAHRALAVRVATGALLWFVVALSYYGLSLAAPPPIMSYFTTGDPDVDMCLDWLFGFAVDLPGYVGAKLLMEVAWCGRRMVCCGGLGLAGLTLGAISFLTTPDGSPLPGSEILFYLGRMGVAAAFAVVYPWSAELIPTDVRGTCMGIFSGSARLGSMLSPFLASGIGPVARMRLVAAPCIVAGLLGVALLPETRGRPLPNSVTDL